MSEPAILSSAYRQLRPPERVFVDGFVADVQRQADRMGERISLALHRAIPADVVDASRGLLDRPMVRAAISERINEIAADTELTPQRLIREVMAIGFSNLEDYFAVGEDGLPMLDLNGLTRDQWAAISQIDIEKDPRNPNMARSIKIRLHPKMDAIAKLGEYMGALAKDNPYWRSDNARPVNGQTALPASASVESAADMYSAMING